MREILFRGKRIDNGEWVYGDLINSYCDMKSYIYSEQCVDDCLLDLIEIDTYTISQYIGIKDKNNKKIFDGDILGGIIYGYVQWIDMQTRFGINIFDEIHECFLEEFERYELEVIGDIYTNPELLEDI